MGFNAVCRRRAFAVKAFFSVLSFAAFAFATCARAAGPQPPCDAATALEYPPPDSAPTFTIWQGNTLEQSNWQPPSCTGWPLTSRSKLLVTLTGSFHFDGAMDELLARVGDISALRNVQYWSTTRNKWRHLAYDASALEGPDSIVRRPDFSASDFKKGADLYYWEKSTSSGNAVYHLSVYESTPDRVAIASENVTPIRVFFVTLFKPNALQSVLFIQRLSPGLFGVYLIGRTDRGASVFADGREESYVNREVALYRQIAGIKTDLEPPAAR